MGGVVVFQLADQVFGIPIEHVREILPIMQVTRPPQMPSDWYGIATIRAIVTPIIDLRLHMRLESKPLEVDTPIIVLQYEGRQIGILVDAVLYVLGYTSQAAVIQHAGQLIITLEVATIFAKTPDIAER
ncbi:MAG: hypothetical protein CUN55_09910 [Phototrophicales bacterium]|nr:MAG: hypothetical protein CUN55_09910 [Phototrophicales bacterium]